jgi:hypothetical protein
MRMADEFDALEVTKTAFLAAASEVPGLGALVEVWNAHDAVELQRRVDRFWRAFVYEAKHTDAKFAAMKKDIDDVQRAFALTSRAVEHARREAVEAKQEVYAVAAVNAIAVGALISFEEKLTTIDTLDILSMEDIDFLRSIAGGPFKVEQLPGTRSEERLGVLVMRLSKLESRGLIGLTKKPTVASQAWSGDIEHWANRWRQKYFEILPFGKKFLTLISSNAPSAAPDSD